MNFYDFIKNDIEEKKALIDVIPHNTDIRRKKFIDIYFETKNTYDGYKKKVAEFILYKYEKLLPVKNTLDLTELDKKLVYHESLLFSNNPYTSYYEKLGFDMLFYNLIHYSDYSLGKINEFLEKFLLTVSDSGVKVDANLFKTNVYGYSYMFNFFNSYFKKPIKPKNDVFESIYWLCPNVIEYIIVDLWVILTNCKVKIERYSKKKSMLDLKASGYKTYEELYDGYIKLKIEKEHLTDEDEYDIVDLAMNGKLDITAYEKGSSLRDADYDFFMINPVNLDNENERNDFYNSIENLRHNFFEYSNYLNNEVLINYYKKKFETPNENIEDKKALKAKEKEKAKASKDKVKEIQTNLKNLKKYKSKYSLNSKSMDAVINSRTKDELFLQNQSLNVVYQTFKDSLKFYYEGVVKSRLKYNSSASEIYKLVVFYPSFSRDIIKEVFEYESYEDVDNKLRELYDYLYYPYKKILDMIPIYVEQNIPQQLLNGFRFENLNLNISSFEAENHGLIFERSLKVLRSRKVDSFKLSVSEIKFLCEVRKLKNDELI